MTRGQNTLYSVRGSTHLLDRVQYPIYVHLLQVLPRVLVVLSRDKVVELADLAFVRVRHGRVEALGLAPARRDTVDKIEEPPGLRIDVELVQDTIDVDRRLAGQDLEAIQQRFRLLAAVSFEQADDDIATFVAEVSCRGEHRVGLADTRRGAEVDP